MALLKKNGGFFLTRAQLAYRYIVFFPRHAKIISRPSLAFVRFISVPTFITIMRAPPI